MSSSQKNLSLISWKLLSELDEMKHEQYSWLIQARESLLGNWKAHRARYRSWRRKVDGLVDDLARKGDAEGANWLAQTILRDHMAPDPADFEITMPTGNGTEIIHIRGCREQPPATTAQQLPTVPGLEPTGAQLPLPSPSSALGTNSTSPVAKKKRGKPHSSVPQPSAATDSGCTVHIPKKHPIKATTESRVITRAQSIQGKHKKTVRDSSRKKIAKRASTKHTKRGPGRPAKSAVTEDIHPEIHPECRYLTWKVVDLRNEVKARNMRPCRHSKATLIHYLIQSDKSGDNEAANTSQLALDDEASTPKTVENESSGSTDQAINATSNREDDAAVDGVAEAGDQAQGEEHGRPSTNDELQVVSDVVSTVVPELSGNGEAAQEVPDA